MPVFVVSKLKNMQPGEVLLPCLLLLLVCLFGFFLHNHILVAFVDGMREGWSFLPQVLLFQKPGLISNHKINFISGLMQLFDC